MPIRLIFFFLFLVNIGYAQFGSISQQQAMADSLFQNQQFEQAYTYYQNIEKQAVWTDSVARGKHYLRLCATAEKLNRLPEAISYHMMARRYFPFANQKENQYYIDRVEQLLPTKTDSLSLSRLYYRYAVLLDKEERRENAFLYFHQALDLAKGLKHYAAVSTIANEIAGEYWDVGKKELSTQFYKESLAAAIALNDSNRMSGAYVNLADNYVQEGDFKTGIRYNLKALEIKERSGDKSRLSHFYLQTADVYHRARNFQKWEEYINKARQILNCEACFTPQLKATLYTELGGLAEYKGDTKKASLYYDTLLVLSKKIAYTNGQKIALGNLALIQKEEGNYQKALDLINQSEAFLTDNPFYLIGHRNIKADLLLKVKKPKQALVLLQENIASNELNNYVFDKLKTWSLLYETNKALSNYSEAFRWNDSLRRLENSLRDEDVRKEMAELETRYQTEKKEQQISLLSAENQIKTARMRLAWLFIGLLLVLVVAVLSIFFLRRKQAALRQSELQQQLLRSQMNPHFIFNVMGSIQSFLYKNEASKAADYLSRFASLSRSVLNFSTKESISLKEEIEMLQNYIELERARMEKPFEVSFEIPEDLEVDFIEIPPMLLQPFVENAIKHGLHDIDYPGKLTLRFQESEAVIKVEIIDNGKGLSVENKSTHKSKALDIFKQRKKVIEQKLKKELTFEFQNLKTADSAKQGVRVCVQLPILNND